MIWPRNTYTPGEPLPVEFHAIGRPVTMFCAGGAIRAGQIVRVDPSDEGLVYAVEMVDGGTFRNVRLGDLSNPQPNTFTYAP